MKPRNAFVVPTARTALAGLAAFAFFTAVSGQTRFTYSSGQVVSPAYEGWRTENDGTLTMVFGYIAARHAAGLPHSS